MRKLLLTLLICLITSVCWAEDYWLYIALEDKYGITDSQTAGMHKKGDIVAITPAPTKRVFTKKEKENYAIVRVNDASDKEAVDWVESWGTSLWDSSIAYRKNKIDITALGLKEGIASAPISSSSFKDEFSPKTALDISRYKRGTAVTRLVKPVKDFYRDKIEPWMPVQIAEAANVNSTLCASGCTYSDMATWESTEDTDIRAGDPYTLEIQEDYVSTNKACANLSGWFTDADSWIEIYGISSGRRDEDDALIFDTGAISCTVDDSGGYSNGISISDGSNFTRIHDLDIAIDSDANAGHCIDVTDNAVAESDADIRMYNLVLTQLGADEGYGIRHSIDINSTYDSRIWNVVIYNVEYGITELNSGSELALYIYNTTVYDATADCLYRYDATTTEAWNVITNTCGGNDYTDASTGDWAGDYNLNEDGTAPSDGNSITNSPTFVGAGTDFHLSSGSQGEDATSDQSSGLFTDDIDSQTRTGSWCIGADEIVSGAAPERRIYLISKNRGDYGTN